MRPHLRRVQLKRRAILQEPHRRAENVSFIEHGIAVILARTQRDGQIGVVGALAWSACVVLGTTHSPHRCVVEVQGEALQIRSQELLQVIDEHPAVRQLLLNYVQALLVQNSQTVLCNARHQLDERLARWLLLACDRVDDNVIPLTHDLFFMMLGVRRAGITNSLAALERSGAVRRRRGAVEVIDRILLEKRTCECYRIIAAEYRRLIDRRCSGVAPASPRALIST